MPALAFGGHDFRIVEGTALFWPSQRALIVADLHLEKASWFAMFGQMLPPYDSQATLQRLVAAVTDTGASRVWCLGDNFHDDDGVHRLTHSVRALLAQLTTTLDWGWITGNHDAHLPHDIGGNVLEEAEIEGIILRHHADPAEVQPELSGHFHPKYRATARGKSVTRPCFVASDRKLILPAYGALTGGLAAEHPEIRAVTGPGARAIIASGSKALSFPLDR